MHSTLTSRILLYLPLSSTPCVPSMCALLLVPHSNFLPYLPGTLYFIQPPSTPNPFCTISPTPAGESASSGVATLLSKCHTITSSHITVPGYVLSISTILGGLSTEIINVYLHPDRSSLSLNTSLNTSAPTQLHGD